MRTPFLAANWKMNKGPSETEDFARSFLSKVQNRTFPCDIVIAPPFVSLAKATEILGNVSSVALAAQNCSQFDSGAYTGEISAMMLKSIRNNNRAKSAPTPAEGSVERIVRG